MHGHRLRSEFRYEHSRGEDCLNEARARRIESVINMTADVGVPAPVRNLPELMDEARAANQRLRMSERVGQCRVVGSALDEGIRQP